MMEAQYHHHHHHRHSSAILREHLQSHSARAHQIDSGTGEVTWRMSRSDRPARYPMSYDSTDKSQEVRDDVQGPSIPRTSLNRGFVEMTNHLERAYGEDPRHLWYTRRHYQDTRHKQLPLSSYTERFRSLTWSKPEHHEEPPYKAEHHEDQRYKVKHDHFEAAYRRQQEELIRIEMMRRERSYSNHFPTTRRGGFPESYPSGASRTYRTSHFHDDSRLRAPNKATRKETSRSENLVIYRDHSRQERQPNSNDSSPTTLPPNKTAAKANSSIGSELPSKRRYQDFATGPEESDDLGLKRAKPALGGMLDILCSATLELGPIQANPSTGCSCPRSNCIKLYCDCFKAGRPCTGMCSCSNCKNTEEETRVDGERIRAIKNTLARNPRAFTGGKKEAVPQNPGDIVCNCLRSQCLKLYCQCFHKGVMCNGACLCISCLNTTVESHVGGKRNLAIQNALEKRPDAFTKKPKDAGSGCACKNNKCLKKYCDCFRCDLRCTEKCICKDCGNGKVVSV